MKIQLSIKKADCQKMQHLFFASMLDFPEEMTENEVQSAVAQIETAQQTAKKICNNCANKKECLDYAFATKQEFGVWGGTTPKERKRIIRWGDGGRTAWENGQIRKRKTKPNTETHQQQTRHPLPH